jgi:hypothetical protein
VEENQAAAALRRCLFKGMSTRGKEAGYTMYKKTRLLLL